MTEPTFLYQAETVREMDRLAIQECHVSGFKLMQAAAQFAFNTLLHHWPDVHHITVICGSGNNAGDGYLLAVLAKKHKLDVALMTVSELTKLTGDAALAYQQASDNNLIPVRFVANSSEPFFMASQQTVGQHIVVDALLGTGLNKAVQGDYASAIEECNQSGLPILAIDIPSGLSGDSGRVMGTAIQATCTASFIGRKLGLMTAQGRHCCGKLYFSDLGIPALLDSQNKASSIQPCATQLDLQQLIEQLEPRPTDAHKGRFGHALLIGGDHGYGGAIMLAAEACARMGAGLTSVATRPEHIQALNVRCPEVMASGVSNTNQLVPLIQRATLIIIGPGLGQSDWSRELLASALQSKRTIVIDADALNLISQHPQWISNTNAHWFCTPHPGEAARLLQCSVADIEADRLASVKRLQHQLGGHILLKGSGSLLCYAKPTASSFAQPSGHSNSNAQQAVDLCPYGNPGMASGGMGDVLSGIIGGLLVQRFNPELAFKLAVCLHAAAADILAQKDGERGLLASDLIPVARTLLNSKHHITC